jgi:hypothetical protein
MGPPREDGLCYASSRISSFVRRRKEDANLFCRRQRASFLGLIRKKGWESLFGSAANNPERKTRLQREIEATDHQIDQLVYELYGLTEEEIGIVEQTSR